MPSEDLVIDQRRRQGAFFTPLQWAQEARNTLDDVLGKDWTQTCLVWDCCAGTGNLTSGQNFATLLSSTLESSDVQVLQQTSNFGFQYNFLQPDPQSIPKHCATLLDTAAQTGQRLVFFINPPYATANQRGSGSKQGVARSKNTTVWKAMSKQGLGMASQQLYAQFVYQCIHEAHSRGFNNYTIAMFSPPLFMSSGNYEKFRRWMYGNMVCKAAWLMKASHFSDVKSNWGISFTVWCSDGCQALDTGILCQLKDIVYDRVIVIGEKKIYSCVTERAASSWAKEPAKQDRCSKLGAGECLIPFLSSGLQVKETGVGNLLPGALCYFANNANNMQDSATLVYFTSSADTRGHGMSVFSSNWRRCIALFSVRKLIPSFWYTQKDEYLTPTITDMELEFEQWVNDCHVYALLHPSNQSTSMRDVLFRGQKWTIHNHFFWKTRDEVKQACTIADCQCLLADMEAPTHERVAPMGWSVTTEPFMATALKQVGDNMSPEARLVLQGLNRLWQKSIKFRCDSPHKACHLHAWDAGVHQLKKSVWGETTLNTEWEALNKQWKILENKLKSGVFKFKFLYPTALITHPPPQKRARQCDVSHEWV